MIRIALANIHVAESPEDSLEIALDAIKKASDQQVEVICFPECCVPGYRIESAVAPVDTSFLEHAWAAIDAAAATANTVVVLGTERVVQGDLRITARVTDRDGSLLGFQDKVQLDPSEDATYCPGEIRRVFTSGELTFGVVICHEGWRYPETVRWAARHGAQVVFHPHTEIVENPDYRPARFADPDNSFHEKAALCRAAENTCFFATVNNAFAGATTTSALIDPQGTLVAHQPYGEHGLLVANIDPSVGTGFLAGRLRSAAGE